MYDKSVLHSCEKETISHVTFEMYTFSVHRDVQE